MRNVNEKYAEGIVKQAIKGSPSTGQTAAKLESEDVPIVHATGMPSKQSIVGAGLPASHS